MRVVSTKKGPGHVLVSSGTEVKVVSLYRCEKAGSCSECVGLQDPHCAWSSREERCEGAQSWPKGSQAAFLQNIPLGRHSSCPEGDLVAATNNRNLGTVINQLEDDTRSEATEHRQDSGHREGSNSLAETDNPTIKASVVLFSLETLIITVSAGAVAALVLGFVTGYCCGRKCGKEENNVPYTDAEYEYFEQRQLPARPLQPSLHPLLQHTDKRPQEETLYAEPILVNHQVNTSNPLGTTLASKAYAPISGMTLVGGDGRLGIHPAAKFNTISNIHKRAGGEFSLKTQNNPSHNCYSPGGLTRPPLVNNSGGFEREPGHHYEKSNLLLNRRGEMVGVTGANTVYHMGTISRASKQNTDKNQQVSQPSPGISPAH